MTWSSQLWDRIYSLAVQSIYSKWVAPRLCVRLKQPSISLPRVAFTIGQRKRQKKRHARGEARLRLEFETDDR